MHWFETCSEFWTDTLQPSDDAMAQFNSHYQPVEWTMMRPLWPRRCFITGKWLWRHRHYKVKVLRKSLWWEMPDWEEVIWIEFEIGTSMRLMSDV